MDASHPPAHAAKESRSKGMTPQPKARGTPTLSAKSAKGKENESARGSGGAPTSGRRKRKSDADKGTPEMGGEFELRPLSMADALELADKEHALQLSITLDAWLSRYNQDGTAAILELLNSLLKASGLQGVELRLDAVEEEFADEPLDQLVTEEACTALIESAKTLVGHVEPYPLADKKRSKRFRSGLLATWGGLFDKIKHELLFDQVLLPWCNEWLIIMCNSSHRGMRHTSTEVAMMLMVRLAELHSELVAQITGKKRQSAGSKKKAGSMAALLDSEVKEAQDRVDLLKEMTNNLFENVFLQRYRDSHDEIRAVCLAALGRCVLADKPSFLQDTYLKYMGWMLNDVDSPSVRVTTLVHLQAVYKGCAKEKPRLANFTERFEGRFVEMCNDVDSKVQGEAMKLVNQLMELGMLSNGEQAMRDVLRVMQHNEPSLIKASVPLLQKHMWRGLDPKAVTSQGEAGDAGGKGSASKRRGGKHAAEDGSKTALLRLARLIASFAKPDDELDSQRAAELCSQVAKAMSKSEPSVSAWAAYVDLLLADGDNGDEQDEDTQTTLLLLMAASASQLLGSVEQEAVDDEADAEVPQKRARRSPTKKDLANQDERFVSLAAELSRGLRQLLQKFGSSASQVAPVLGLVGKLRLASALQELKGSKLGDILHELEAISLKSSSVPALKACGEAWRQLLTQEDAPALQERVALKFNQLRGKLQQALKPLATALASAVSKKRKSKTPEPDFDEAEVQLRRLALLGRQTEQGRLRPFGAALEPLPELLLTLLDTKSPNLNSQGSDTPSSLVRCLDISIQMLMNQFLEAVWPLLDRPAAKGVASEETLERAVSLHKSTMTIITAAVQSSSTALAKSAVCYLSVMLASSRTLNAAALSNARQDQDDGGDADEDSAVDLELEEEARALLLSRLQEWLDAAAAGEEHDDAPDPAMPTAEVGDDEEPRGVLGLVPRWVTEIVRCALLNALPKPRTFQILLSAVGAGELRSEYARYLQALIQRHLFADEPAAQAELQLQILVEAAEHTNALRPAAIQLARLHPAPRHKERHAEGLRRLFDLGLRHGFASISEVPVRRAFLQQALGPFTARLGQEDARLILGQLNSLRAKNPRDAAGGETLEERLQAAVAASAANQTPRGSKPHAKAAHHKTSGKPTARGARRSQRVRDAQEATEAEDEDEDEEDEEEEVRPGGTQGDADEDEEEEAWDGRVEEESDEGEEEEAEEAEDEPEPMEVDPPVSIWDKPRAKTRRGEGAAVDEEEQAKQQSVPQEYSYSRAPRRRA